MMRAPIQTSYPNTKYATELVGSIVTQYAEAAAESYSLPVGRSAVDGKLFTACWKIGCGWKAIHHLLGDRSAADGKLFTACWEIGCVAPVSDIVCCMHPDASGATGQHMVDIQAVKTRCQGSRTTRSECGQSPPTP